MRARSTTVASSAALRDPASTATFTYASRSLPTPKASSPISSDTVNPIPERIASPATSTQAKPSSRSARVKRATSQVAARMPTGLPSTSPTTMPTATGSVSAVTRPLAPPIATPAENSAKIGTATPAERGRKRCSKCSARPGPASGPPARSLRRTGTMKPSRTPATVACTPEACTSVHTAKASGSSNHHDRTRRCTRTAKIPSGAMATRSGTTCSSAVKKMAMIVIARRSSTTASVSRNVRSADGRLRPITASTARAKAMSVATGIAQPCVAPPSARELITV